MWIEIYRIHTNVSSLSFVFHNAMCLHSNLFNICLKTNFHTLNSNWMCECSLYILIDLQKKIQPQMSWFLIITYGTKWINDMNDDRWLLLNLLYGCTWKQHHASNGKLSSWVLNLNERLFMWCDGNTCENQWMLLSSHD
jgi:hypothetical protein